MQRDPKHPKIQLELLDRYLAGECSPPEVGYVAEWLAEHPDQAVRVEGNEQRDSWARARAHADWQELQKRITGDIPTAPAKGTRRPQPVSSTRMVSARLVWMVAAFTLMLTVGISMRDTLAPVFTGKHTRGSASVESFEVVHEYATRPGEHVRIALIDGSEVILGPASTLRVIRDFGAGTRQVNLSGMGHFRVAQDPTAPFIVTSGEAKVEVLGTVFGIRNYENDPDVTVAVQEGRVAVSSVASRGRIAERSVLNADDLAHVAHSEISVFNGSDIVQDALAWVDDLLIFDNTLLADALPELARWYGVDFVVKDSSLYDLRLTGGFGQQSVDDLVHVLGSVLQINATYSKRVIMLSRRNMPLPKIAR